MSKRRKALLLPRLAGALLLGFFRYLLALLTCIVCAFVFHVLNTTKVHGRAFWRLRRGTVIVSNHQSLIDSFLVTFTLAIPQCLLAPWLLPWHLPERRNFFNTKALRVVMALWKAIPVDRSPSDRARNITTYRRIMDALRHGTVHIFLEGTRSRDERMLPPKPAVAKLILETRASVLLVGLNGMHGIQPHRASPDEQPKTIFHALGRRFAWMFHFRTGKHVDVVIGDRILAPEELVLLAGSGSAEERSVRLAHALSDRIRQLRDSVHSLPSAA